MSKPPTRNRASGRYVSSTARRINSDRLRPVLAASPIKYSSCSASSNTCVRMRMPHVYAYTTHSTVATPSQNEHGVAERVEAIALLHGEPVQPPRLLDPCERHHEREQRRAWQVEVRDQGVDASELEARRDEELGAALERPAARKRLEHAHGRRANGEHALGGADAFPGSGGHRIPLAVDRVLLEPLGRDGPKRVEADVQRHALDLELREELRREVESRRRRSRRPGLLGVDRLVAIRIVERSGDVRRQRCRAVGLTGEPQPPASLPEMLEQLDRSVPAARFQPPGRPRESFPHIAFEPLEQEHLATRRVDRDPRRYDLGVVDHRELAVQLLRQRGEAAVADRAGRALIDEEPRIVAAHGRMLRDQLRRQVVVELGEIHPTATVTSLPMDAEAIARAQARIEEAAGGRVEPAAVDAALERAREQVEALAAAAAELESSLPSRVGDAVQDGLPAQVLPVARHLAEVRGLMNQLIRRLERVEGDLLTERHARVDDLALLVDLVSSGWRGVDERLARIEEGIERRSGATVYRIEERRPEPLGPEQQTG